MSFARMINAAKLANFLKPRRSLIETVRYQNQAAKQVLTLNSMEICSDPPSRGVVFGVYADENDKADGGILTKAGWNYNVKKTNNRLIEVLRMSGPMPKRGEVRLLFAIEPEKIPYYSAVAIVGLGKECLGYNSYEVLDEQKESIRRGVAAACSILTDLDTDRIEVDAMEHAESAAEGAGLGIWRFQEYSSKSHIMPAIDLYATPNDPCDFEGWKIGLQKAAAQNLTRTLQEMPSNLLTPTSFAQNVVEILCKTGVNVEVKVEGWADAQLMHSFLAVGRASCEAPIFLELSYFGGAPDERPIVLVGQGVTYDAGGLCLKEYPELRNMRGDMTGAAIVVAAFRAISTLRIPINIRGLIPLCENVIGCNSYKPGDICRSGSGKNVEVEGTEHEGTLVLADALMYAQNFCPKFILDIGTTSGHMRNALDEAASGVFTNSEILWQQIKSASMHTGDRVWRFPLWDYYTTAICDNPHVDIINFGRGRGGRPCKAAALLREFVPCGQWMHIVSGRNNFKNIIFNLFISQGRYCNNGYAWW